jgi:glycine cleavage system transcriptional repressor
VTVVGHDRPGIIAETTAALASLGGNLEDSTMTILRGHFAMTLVVAVDAPVDAVEQALAPLSADGSLAVYVRALPDESDHGGGGTPYLLTVHGGDRPGIVSAVTRVVADAGGNITDLTTRLVATSMSCSPRWTYRRGRTRAAGGGTAIGRRVAGGRVSLRPGEPDVL